jgi:hypothetical protein
MMICQFLIKFPALPELANYCQIYHFFYHYRSTSAMMMMLKSLTVKTLKIFIGSRRSRTSGMWLKLLKRRQHATFHMLRTFYCLQTFIVRFRRYGPYSPPV